MSTFFIIESTVLSFKKTHTHVHLTKLIFINIQQFDGGRGYPFSPICPNGPNCSLSHLGSPIDCPMTIISTIKTASNTRIQQIATATIALLLIKLFALNII